MKKKLLSIFLSLAMVVTMMPAMTMTAFADDNVAKIGSMEYATLQDAIDHVENGQTIEILGDLSYNNPLTISNGKTFNIDFNDGSTSHSFTWDVTVGQAYQRDIIIIEGNSNVTVKNMEFLVGTHDEHGNRIFKVNSTGKLTLNNMTLISGDSIRNTPVQNNGGTVVIDGGFITTNDSNNGSIPVNERPNPIVQNLGGTTTFKGNGTYTMQNNSTGAAWLGRVITLYTQSTDDDRDNECGTVIIENGTFNTGQIVDVNGKGNITINNAIHSSNSAAIKTFHGGIKSKITVNNITTSTLAFAQVIEELDTKIDFQNGNVKYMPTRFCMNNSGSPMTSVSIKNGKFGPKSGTTDIHDEIEGFLATGATLTALTSDPDEYTYEVVESSQPTPTPTPSSEDLFESYKLTQKSACDKLVTADDSETVKALVEDAKKAIGEIKYDYTKTLAENKAVVDSIVAQLKSDIDQVRVDEATTAIVEAAKVNLIKATPYKNGKIKLKFKALKLSNGAKVTSYQIYRSTSKKFNKSVKKYNIKRTKNIKNYTWTNAKKLKKGTKYYYKVRGRVKLSDGTYAYTQWSKVKTAKCKKSR